MKHDIVLHASTTASSFLRHPPCWNKHDAARHVTSRLDRTCRACRVVTWHNKWNLGLCVLLGHRCAATTWHGTCAHCAV